MPRKNVQIFFLLFFAAYSCTSPQSGKEPTVRDTSHTQDKPTDVKTVRLKYGTFHYELISNGTISALRKAEMRFQGAGNVSEIFVRNGDFVNQGQKIASLDRFHLENAFEQAKDNLERAKLELQDVLIGQGYSLSNKTGIPDEVMKIARIKSGYDQSLINYKLSAHNLKAATLYAPFSGVVANLVTKENNASDGASAFCTIIDIQHPEVVFMILENELPLIKKGDRVFLNPFSMNDFTASGKVTEINPSVDRNGMVRIVAQADNSQHRLVDGMNVKVRVQRAQDRQLLIPKSALVLRSNRKVVFTEKNGLAQWVYVETGRENSESYVVTSGLNEGDEVIYDGNINLAHESPVAGTKKSNQ